MAHGDNKIKFSNPLKNLRALMSIGKSKITGFSSDTARGSLLRKKGLSKPKETNVELARRRDRGGK